MPAARRRGTRERATQANNYWSATTNADNPDNAWNVNFNNGNVNNDNKTNNNYVRAVRGGLWSLDTTCARSGQVTALCLHGGGEPPTAFRHHVFDVRLH